MKALFIFGILLFSDKCIAQSLNLKDLKFIYNSIDKEILPHLRLQNSSWTDGADQRFTEKDLKTKWWTVLSGPSSSIGKKPGDKFTANVFLITESLATAKQLYADIEKAGMKSINDKADYTDGYYIISFNTIKDDYGKTIFGITFARKEFFK